MNKQNSFIKWHEDFNGSFIYGLPKFTLYTLWIRTWCELRSLSLGSSVNYRCKNSWWETIFSQFLWNVCVCLTIDHTRYAKRTLRWRCCSFHCRRPVLADHGLCRYRAGQSAESRLVHRARLARVAESPGGCHHFNRWHHAVFQGWSFLRLLE